MKRPFSAYQGDEPYVFVCYAHEDSSSVYPEMQCLHEAGVRMWYDEGISPGTRWSDELARALSKASLVLFFCTPQSVKSKHCQDEINFALDKERPLLVIQEGPVDLPLGMQLQLGAHQSILKHELSAERFADKLTAAITRHVRPSAATEPQTPSHGPVANRATAGQRTKWIMLGAVAITVLALAYFGVEKFGLSKQIATEQPVSVVAPTVVPAARAIAEKSIAILPFTDMSEKKDQEYLGDGMAEEIINLLAQVPDLLVPARTSSFYFKGKQTKVPDIARELGVTHVLEGSIRRSGDHLRVTAQLVRADNGYHLWSETYDRELKDVFNVQDDIANAVVQALQIKLTGGELSRRKGGTQNLEAYQLFLRATSALAQNTPSSVDAAGEYLDQAIKLDPSFGWAWSQLASTEMLKVITGSLAPAQGYERARQLAQHALQLSPDLAQAHNVLYQVHQYYDWDWAAAEIEGQRALAVDPTNPSSLAAAGDLSARRHHWDDAERQLRSALVRDPLDTYLIWTLGTVYHRAGRFAEAEATYQKVLELAPGFLWARVAISMTLLAQDKPEAALAMVQQEVDGGRRLSFLPIALQANGRQAEADDALQALIAQQADRSAYFVAAAYACRGDHDLALQWLERAYEQKDAMFNTMVVGDPLFKNIADDPRYQAFVRKLKLPQ